jgi:E3 ubiquitin-protein ligase SHPRH
MKSEVKDELTIPQQTRYLVGVEMNKVERQVSPLQATCGSSANFEFQVYDQTLEQALRILGLDAQGVAASSGWEVDGSVLRNQIRRLRGLCTHPQVGQLQKQGENKLKSGGIKSMSEVLEVRRSMSLMMSKIRAFSLEYDGAELA